MNHASKFSIVIFTSFVLFTALLGCAKKPPGCADPQTIETIRSLTIENVQKAAVPSPQYPNPYADDPQGLVARFFKEMKFELTNVVSNGYSSDARRYSCQGQLTVTTNGETLASAIEYSTQITESPESSFLVQIQDFAPFVRATSGKLQQHFEKTRFIGEWRGEYACGGIDGAQDGPKGPFKMPVTLQSLTTGEVRLERTTKVGGFEKLSGVRGKDEIRLRGTGSNSPDDTWRTMFTGKVTGMDFTATGEIATEDGRVMRQCTLALKLPSN